MFSVNTLIISKITNLLPPRKVVGIQQWPHLHNLDLADPEYNLPGNIDVLFGSDVYGDLVADGVKRVIGAPVAMNTVFGWVLLGPTLLDNEPSHVTNLMVNEDLNASLKRFWELEEPPIAHMVNSEEQQCEDYFKQTHDLNGRSWAYAITSPSQSMSYYIPHHAVFKESSTTTKLHVVFDASCKSSTGVSLNEKLMIGPKLQGDLFDILLRFRLSRIALTADVTKMYRQILLSNEDIDFQRICWRESPTDPITDYCLHTVTYGTSAAPYLAIKCLRQVAVDHQNEYPKAAVKVLNDFYVDDLLTGCDNTTDALCLQQQLISLLQRGGFCLTKWASNDPALMTAILESNRECKILFDITPNESIKTLGLVWYPLADVFSFDVVQSPRSLCPTKRCVLSDASKLFDPLGWLSPTVIITKLIMRELWVFGCDWDEELPNDLKIKWMAFKEELMILKNVKIDRRIGKRNNNRTTIHGFCDASQHAYAAVVYARTEDPTGKVNVHLITAKTRVAPVKRITIPRLELCGAALLSNLMKTVQSSFGNQVENYVAWCDSEIVLAWIKKSPNSLKTFVGNRVASIQSLTNPSWWRYVPTKDNPADMASRGISPSKLIDNNLWWHGPSWLKKNEICWPKITKIVETSLDEEISTESLLEVSSYWSLLDKYSSLNELNRATAYIFRFIINCKRKRTERIVGPITVSEIQHSMVYWLKHVQSNEFANEIKCCSDGQQIHRKSSLCSLNPFIDRKTGLLRVGGRIKATNLSFDNIHQIILPNESKLTKLIISDLHLSHLHAGVQLMLCALRRKYWLTRARTKLRSHIHQCVKCMRQKKINIQQIMANLPSNRITPARPFLYSGIDYASSVQIRVAKGRCKTLSKCWIALFVCMATKAVHLELVSDISTDGFLAAFRRFISRRGNCLELSSDNGTNFVGAHRELRKLLLLAPESVATQGTKWKFIPPASPHQGGIWESGVKQVKHHLRRVLGASILIFEEMATTLCQIEACLNSRPLCAMSDDADDLQPLTPAAVF